MRILPLVALVSLVAAGCAGPTQTSGTPREDECKLEPVLCDPGHYLANHHCIKQDVRPRVYAPDTPGPDSAADPWVQGDWWTYRLQTARGTKSSALVYYDDADIVKGRAEHYMVGVPTREEALEHAVHSVNPMIGRIHRALYSPHESGVHADMFNFPLCQGATWQSGFYGRTFTFTASAQTVRLPDGSFDDGFLIQGTAADGSTVRHTYSPQVKWFTELHLQRNDGLTVRMDLTAFGEGRTGRMEFLRAQKDEFVDVAVLGSEGYAFKREAGKEGPYDAIGVGMHLTRTAGTGKIEVHLRDPAGTSRACVGVSGSGPLEQTTCPAGPILVEVPWAEGEWRITKEILLVDQQTKATGEVRVASIYDRGGTV
jgi:hypothetical protein